MNGRPVPERKAAPADLSVLADLVGDDPQVIAEMLDAFRQSAAAAALELRASVRAGAAPAPAAAATAGDIAHRIKAAARAIGAAGLADICAQIETGVPPGREGELLALLRAFEFELAAVNRFLDAAQKATA